MCLTKSTVSLKVKIRNYFFPHGIFLFSHGENEFPWEKYQIMWGKNPVLNFGITL